jgi:hypothetical protein
MRLSDYWQQLGLFVINRLARSLPALREEVPDGESLRHRLGWYRHPVIRRT